MIEALRMTEDEVEGGRDYESDLAPSIDGLIKDRVLNAYASNLMRMHIDSTMNDQSQSKSWLTLRTNFSFVRRHVIIILTHHLASHLLKLANLKK